MLNFLIVCVAPLGVELGCVGLQWVAVRLCCGFFNGTGRNPLYLKKNIKLILLDR
jgi:hypothetical protein